MLDHLTPPAALIWGIISRGIGLVFLVSFLSLSGQVVAVAGRAGATPVARTLDAIRRDFPTWRRFLYFPTLLWIDASDATLRALTWLGALAALSIVVGGPHVVWAFAVCYLIYLSLDRPMNLVFPWDSVLFEAGFWGMLLPATRLLPDLAAVSAPLPAVAWVYRLLVFRVIFGFGKHKFLGTTPQDFGFLKGFMVNQPLPTPVGWLSNKLPMWALKLALLVMFIVEIPLSFAVFFPGPWSAAAGVAIIGLMVAIQVTGNFGYFNLVMVFVALSWCDTDTARRFTFAGFTDPGGPVWVHRLVLLHSTLALAAFPFNTFCSQTWMNWSPLLRVRSLLVGLQIHVFRYVQPFRIAHAYGVFPPQSPPQIRVSPVTEVTWDGVEWHPLVHRHWQTLETSPPTFCAPHHNRFDQAVVYEGLGLNEQSMYRNIIGRWDPYGHGGDPVTIRMMRMLLQGALPRRFYDSPIEAQRGRPRAVRVRTYMLEPASLGELRAEGRWWRKTLIGPHHPPMQLGQDDWEAPEPPPELWHFEDLVWLRRSRLGALMTRAARGEDPHALVILGAEGITKEDVERFWEEFVPTFASRHRESWTGLRASVGEARQRYGRSTLHRFERLAGRYGALLLARLEPSFLDRGVLPVFGRVSASLDVPSYFHLRLLTFHLIGDGREAYDAALAEPGRAGEAAKLMTMASGGALMALFRYEALVYQSQKLRLLAAFTEFDGRPEPTERQREAKRRGEALTRRLFGALDFIAFLKTQFSAPEDVLDVKENLPRFRIEKSGEVVRA